LGEFTFTASTLKQAQGRAALIASRKGWGTVTKVEHVHGCTFKATVPEHEPEPVKAPATEPKPKRATKAKETPKSTKKDEKPKKRK